MFEAGQCRRKEDGSFEYLRTQSWHSRRGYVEVWEPAATHVTKNLALSRVAPEFHASLVEAGLEASEGLTLHDLLVMEGWVPPEEGYIEIAPATNAIGRVTLETRAIEAPCTCGAGFGGGLCHTIDCVHGRSGL